MKTWAERERETSPKTYLEALLARASVASPNDEFRNPPSLEAVEFILDDCDARGPCYVGDPVAGVSSREMSLRSDEYALRVVRTARLLDAFTREMARELVSRAIEAVTRDLSGMGMNG